MTTTKFKPLLSATIKTEEDLQNINFPVMVSPKLDGIRVLASKDGVFTRSMKPVRNKHIQKELTKVADEVLWRITGMLDGEIVIGKPNDPDVFNKSTSGVMSIEGEPEFTFYVFDRVDEHLPFHRRHEPLYNLCSNFYMENNYGLDHLIIHPVLHTECKNVEELLEIEQSCIEHGFEGIMIRDPDGRYKYGRSTLKEGILMKLLLDSKGDETKYIIRFV